MWKQIVNNKWICLQKCANRFMNHLQNYSLNISPCMFVCKDNTFCNICSTSHNYDNLHYPLHKWIDIEVWGIWDVKFMDLTSIKYCSFWIFNQQILCLTFELKVLIWTFEIENIFKFLILVVFIQRYETLDYKNFDFKFYKNQLTTCYKEHVHPICR